MPGEVERQRTEYATCKKRKRCTMKLGVYSIVLPDYRREEAAKLVRDVGYTGIEWTVGYPDNVFGSGEEWHVSMTRLEDDAPRAREVAERYGLAIPSLGTYAESDDWARIERILKAAQVMGAPNVRLGSASYDGSTPYPELFKKVVGDWRTIEQMAADHGVRALIEIHGGTICPSAAATLRVLEHFDPQHVGCILDPGNMVTEGMENWRMGIEMLGPYIAHVHAKNMGWYHSSDRGWYWDNASLEGGIADFRAIFRALKDYGYQGYINLEDFRGGYCVRPEGITTEEKLREAFEFQTRLLAEMD